MSWTDYALARAYLTEMTVGVRAREAKAAEDAEFHKARTALEMRR